MEGSEMTRHSRRAHEPPDQQAKADRLLSDKLTPQIPLREQSSQWPIWLPESNADVLVWSMVAAFVIVAAYVSIALLSQ
jgi:hypothetical protein